MSRSISPPNTDRIAHRAAHLLVEGLATEPEQARRKVAAELGIRERRDWPSLEQIARQWKLEMDLFSPMSWQQDWRTALLLARDAMRSLADFSPRLTGAAALGMMPPHAALRLVLWSEPLEQLLWHLQERGISHRQGEIELRLGPTSPPQRRPLLSFLAGGRPVQLIVLERADRGRKLYSADGEDAWPLIDSAGVDELLDATAGSPQNQPPATA